MTPLAKRQPIYDVFKGAIVCVQKSHLLACENIHDDEIVFQGEIVIRYGIRFLGKHHLSIVPGLVILDYGEILTGEEAWHFLLKKSNLYPRADVIGYRNDGIDEMLSVKQLDLALPIEVLAFKNLDAHMPLTHINAIACCPHRLLPQRIARYLPQLNTLEDWTPDA